MRRAQRTDPHRPGAIGTVVGSPTYTLTADDLGIEEEAMRYEIHAIADADCTRVRDEVLASTDDPAEAKRLAAEHSSRVYGAAIVDTETGAIDSDEDEFGEETSS